MQRSVSAARSDAGNFDTVEDICDNHTDTSIESDTIHAQAAGAVVD